MSTEANARLVINAALTASGWQLVDIGDSRANVYAEAKSESGFADYLLFDSQGFPIAVIESKALHIDPLSGKEQARGYARDHNARFVFLSNGATSYSWDIVEGNPEKMLKWPSPGELEQKSQRRTKPDSTKEIDPVQARQLLASEPVGEDYIARSQRSDFDQNASWKNPALRPAYIGDNKLRFLRPYQINALVAVQDAVKLGKTRFLLEMATGTGKTLSSAALIKLFLRTGSAKRVLFLVDRLELEDQAHKAFVATLSKDYISVVYKKHKTDWRKANIVVTTVQSLMTSDRFKEEFRPADFGLVISDEAHRSISGNAREVFEYFRGFKLGLTATPRDLLRGVWATENDISEFEMEKRNFHDTYRIFGCESGVPTFRYGLLDGVKEGYLVNPTVLDCRTEKTTKLLSEQGLMFSTIDEDGNEVEEIFGKRDFEKTYFSEETNIAFVRTFLDHALKDPVSMELGKSLLFCVSQSHAGKITNLLNIEASKRWPGKYQSNFARQVTSSVTDAQQMTVQFSENNLGGKTPWLKDYDSSRVRICVTVGMMTTGYDCEDVLNVVLMRPVFSPSEFIQMKGRGTRKHTFSWTDPKTRQGLEQKKTGFHLFDFFANYEFFEAEYDYEAIKPIPLTPGEWGKPEGVYTPPGKLDGVIDDSPDETKQTNWITIGSDGMKIDRMFWQNFSSKVHADEDIQTAAKADDWETVLKYVRERFLGASEESGNDEAGRSLSVIRALVSKNDGQGLEAFFAKLFGKSIKLPTKNELLDLAFERFATTHPPKPEVLNDVRFFFKSYVGERRIREIIDSGKLVELNSTVLTPDRLKRLPEWPQIVAEIRSEVDLDRFA